MRKLVGFRLYLHCIVNDGVFEEEPEDTVVRFSMDALLLEEADLFGLPRQDVELEHFYEGVTVLWGELNRKFEEVLGLNEIEVLVVAVVSHGEASTFAPDFTGFWNFLESLVERVEHLIEVFLSVGTCVLELDQSCPQPASRKVYLKRMMYQVFCLFEAATSDFK